jgi:hypothetical protein
MNDFAWAIAAVLGAIVVVTGIDAYVFLHEVAARQ